MPEDYKEKFFYGPGPETTAMMSSRPLDPRSGSFCYEDVRM